MTFDPAGRRMRDREAEWRDRRAVSFCGERHRADADVWIDPPSPRHQPGMTRPDIRDVQRDDPADDAPCGAPSSMIVHAAAGLGGGGRERETGRGSLPGREAIGFKALGA